MKTFSLETDAFTARYDYLWKLSDDRWAWEYARRSTKVRRYAEGLSGEDISEIRLDCADIRLLRSRTPQTMAERLGFVFMPDPALNALEADAVWTHQAYPGQIEVHCTPLLSGRRCDLWEEIVPSCRISHVTDCVGREYLLIRGQGSVVQVRCSGLSLLGMEPVKMRLTVSEIAGFEQKVRAQRAALNALCGRNDTPRPLWTKRTQLLRDGLIALDCLEMGLPRRQICAAIYGDERVDAEWNGPSMKHAVRYLVKKAEALRDGGYLTGLLGGRPATAPIQA